MERLAADRSRWAVRVRICGATMARPSSLTGTSSSTPAVMFFFPTRRTATIALTGGLHPDSPALPADGWRLRVLCVLDAAGRSRPGGVPDAAIVRPATTCRYRVSNPPCLFAMGAVLVGTRVGDCGTDGETRARDRQRREAPIGTAPDAGACIDHRGITRRGRLRSAGATTSARIGGPSKCSCAALALKRRRRCRV